MTVKQHLQALAVLATATLTLLVGTSEAACVPTAQATPRAEIDARKGRVLLTVLHDANGELDGARFYAGRFVFKPTASWPTGRPIIVTDLSNPISPLRCGRGIDIARIDGEIVP